MIYLLMGNEQLLCDTLEPVMTLLGYLIKGIQYIVPVLLIVIGMFTLAKAVASQDDKEVKSAQKSLITKVVVAICVYLVITLVGLIMNLIKVEGWKNCTDCLFHPFDSGCDIIDPNIDTTN